ncbi:MAG: cobalamin B12-binding domain protein [Anaerocolumna sp.]|nr:cobalamin B12-binding domain protein [Anaerocolumna sp.]
MKILLVGINAKYIHSNLAIHYLKAYAQEYASNITLKEFTINQYTEDILLKIYKEKPDFIGFSCYIWNMSMVLELSRELKKLLPGIKIWLGGPEVSFDAKNQLTNHTFVDGIMYGEGEETFLQVLHFYMGQTNSLALVSGIAYRENVLEKEEIILNPPRREIDLSLVPFPYEDMKEFENKIIYYETSRGCPYSCSYCLSSVDKRVRMRDVELVKKELKIFLNYKVPQVKFVDRTFNCNHKHTLAIWQFIIDNDNGITNFHFEISADILSDEEISLLNSMREGLVQLEVGVQSTNDATIQAITRHMDLSKLKRVVAKIQEGKNIHQHLDLIAGLPYEDINTFRNSFNEVYEMNPDQFQLGFLKVLKGSAMHRQSLKWGIVYRSAPPYEVLYTNWLTYEDVLKLKRVEEMVEVYYNSGQFEYSVKFLLHFFESPFDFYLSLGDFYEVNGLDERNHTRIKRYEILIDFLNGCLDKEEYDPEVKKEYKNALLSILVHDLYLREKLKSRPYFATPMEEYKEKYRKFYLNTDKVQKLIATKGNQITGDQIKSGLHLEHYDIDIKKTAESGKVIYQSQFLMYDYIHRSNISSQASIYSIGDL